MRFSFAQPILMPHTTTMSLKPPHQGALEESSFLSVNAPSADGRRSRLSRCRPLDNHAFDFDGLVPMTTMNSWWTKNEIQHTIDKTLGIEIKRGQSLFEAPCRHVVESDD